MASNGNKMNIFDQIDDDLRQQIKYYKLFDDSILFVTNEDRVYGIGDNEYGKLGLSSDVDSSQELVELRDKRIKDFFIGQTFCMALSKDNILYSGGCNHHGQLARGYVSDLLNYHTPCSIRFPDECVGLEIISVSCDQWNAMVVFDNEKVYVWGWNALIKDTMRYLGKDHDTIICSPKNFETDLNVKFVHCYSNRFFIITTDEKVYSWGNNHNNCLGYYQYRISDYFEPKLIEQFNNVNITDIQSSEVDTYFLSSSGDLYYCGQYEDNECNQYTEYPVQILCDDKFIKMECNENNIILSANNIVYELNKNQLIKTAFKTFQEYSVKKHEVTLDVPY